MRILLVKPKPRLETIISLKPLIFMEPLELGYIAAVVPPGHEVKVLDLRLAEKNQFELFSEKINSFKPDIIGFSAYTHEASIVKQLAALAKKNLENTFVVTGGHHATILPYDYNIPCIDAIVRGEGTRAFGELVGRISEGWEPYGIPDVLFTGDKFESDKVAILPEYPDMAAIPVPRRDLWNYENYSCIWPAEKHTELKTIFPSVALLRTSYGCPMDCSFCVVPRLSGRRHLTRDVNKITDEISSLKPDNVYFCDDETFSNSEHIVKLAEAIKSRRINKRYFAWARSTTVLRKPDIFKLWRDIGLDAVFLGFEAITDATLKSVSKHSTVADNENAHRLMRESGIAVVAGFMVMPDFSEQDFDAMENYIKNMPSAQFNITVCTPSPGSSAWEKEKDSFVCNPFDLHDCMHPLTKTRLPLKLFYERFARLVSVGAAKNPLNSPGNKIPLADLGRVLSAGKKYAESLRNAYNDFPENPENLC
ncbi:MAG: hypothetical protein A2017_02695 [Lentisphaerae bacterium GWF2_44_16]|nr:MAG: hypothetical protein A2017_02695 [Lentisphaerae bacterium GWF2_44_16]